jgi:adenosylcobinamide-GDP ribazoletransferase
MRGFFSALAFLTVIPIPDALKSRLEGGMFAGYPAAGLFIGALLSLAYLAAGRVFPPSVAAVALIAASLLLTGALHLDGLADCADAFYGKRDRASVLRILKDPRIGTMGGGAIGLSLLSRYAALGSLPSSFILVGLPLISTFSRTVVLCAMRLLPYARNEAGIFPSRPVITPRLLALAVLVSVALTVLLPIPLLAAVLALVLFWRLSWKKIGGYTGDVLGASIEIAEIVSLVTLAALANGGAHWTGAFPILGLFLGAGG